MVVLLLLLLFAWLAEVVVLRAKLHARRKGKSSYIYMMLSSSGK